MLKFFLALRYLRKHRITLFAVLSVLFGSLAFTLVMGVMDGYVEEFYQRSRNITGDLVVSPPRYSSVAGASRYVDLVRRVPQVEAAAPVIGGVGILKIPSTDPTSDVKFAIEWCNFTGVDPEPELAVTRPNLEPALSAAELDAMDREPGKWIILGRDLMDAFKLKPGDRVWLVTSRSSGIEQVRPKEELTVAGSVSFGIFEHDRQSAYVPRDVARRLLGLYPDSASAIQVRLRPGVRPDEGARLVEQALDTLAPTLFRAYAYYETSGNFRALAAQRDLSRLILFFLFLVAGFAVVAVLFMIVLQKRRDIGILRSLGCSRRSVAWTFLSYAGVVAVTGGSAGLLLAWLVLSKLDAIRAGILRTTGYDPFPANLYGLDHVPWMIEPFNPVLVMVLAVVVSLTAGLLPALWAARLNPIESLTRD